MESSKAGPGPKPPDAGLVERLAATMAKWGDDEFAAALRAAVLARRAAAPGVRSGELLALAAVGRAIDDHGAEEVLGALREAARIHGGVPAAADAHHGYSARIVDAVQRHFDHDPEDDDVFRAFKELI
jgi:hypothetical protein